MIKLMDILLEGNAKRERRYLKNELKKPYSTFWKKSSMVCFRETR